MLAEVAYTNLEQKYNIVVAPVPPVQFSVNPLGFGAENTTAVGLLGIVLKVNVAVELAVLVELSTVIVKE
jgi:hypothetical protein